MLPFLPLFISLFSPSLMHLCWAALVNVTIDDTLPDPIHDAVVYDPPSAWNSKEFCPRGPCSISPDPSRIQSGTWHESTFHARLAPANDFPNQPLSATANFRGSAVYVYAVLPPATGTKASTAAITFYIDGVLVDEFSHISGPDYVYNVLVYANSSLSLGSHTITIVNGKPAGENSLFILDSIVYSTDADPQSLPPVSTGPEEPVSTPTSPSDQTSSTRSTEPGGSLSSSSPSSGMLNDSNAAPSHSLSTGGIVGAVIGSLAGVLAFLLAVLYCRRRRINNDSWVAHPQDIRRSNLLPQPISRPPASWVIASDSKRDILMAVNHPPAYHEV